MTSIDEPSRPMPSDETTPSKTVTREDDQVGKPGAAPVDGGHQTPEQAAITRTGSVGRSDGERNEGWRGGEPGRSPVAVGGSSGGHSDRKDAGSDRRVADGQEHDHHKGDKEQP